MVELGEVRRESGFEFLHQAQRELIERTVPTAEIIAEIDRFQIAWTLGASHQELAARFRFRKVHDAECARKGILLYEIYVQRGRYRAVVAWTSAMAPGYWVSVFKKQGDAQSRASLKTAGERALEHWRQEHAR